MKLLQKADRREKSRHPLFAQLPTQQTSQIQSIMQRHSDTMKVNKIELGSSSAKRRLLRVTSTSQLIYKCNENC